MTHFELNPQQKEAVAHDSGPLMILAGAGAGKTRVITQRILELIKKGTPPEKNIGSYLYQQSGQRNARTGACHDRC